LLAGALLFVHWRRSQQPERVRRALIAQLAELEEGRESAGERWDRADLARYEQERTELRARLRTLD
jgi:hypothetical protein